MELKQFIKEALLSITGGVEEANKRADLFKILGIKHESGLEGNYADFDVSVVVNESSSDKTGGGINTSFLRVVSAGINSKIDQTSSHQNTHHLTFRVFISKGK
ncbi:MAG: hypothetical protein PHI53_00975 [Candidatus Pacebacteria bacterium]|nr:hypothetical protein [Candidatus Paceibacterota bacterium]